MFYRSSIAAAAVLGALCVASGDARAWDDSKYPDFSGQWRPIGGPGRFDISKPAGRGQQAPLTPEYQAIFEATLKDRAVGGLSGDPTGLCLPHGLPRMMVAIFPVEFVVTPKITYYMTDYTTSRRIFTDDRDWPKDLLPSFNGYSIGHWVDTDGDGRYDLLEVETRGFTGPRAYDSSGIPFHDDNQSIIKERIYLDKNNRNLLLFDITVIDHALTRPWQVLKSYRREAGAQPSWFEEVCGESNNHIQIGKENYMISGDGMLMPTKKGQKPPDLKYFPGARK